MKRKEILDAIEEMVDEVRKFGDIPHALICSKKTFEKISLEIHALSPLEEKFIPLELFFKYEFGDLPVVKFKYCPEDKVFVVNKHVYERLMKVMDDNVFPDEIKMDKILKRYRELKKAKIL